jgi:PAS domain S-box-containing protein
MDDFENQARLYRLLVENSLGLMCIHDLNGVLISINPAVAESLGYPAAYGHGRNLREFLMPAVRHIFDDYLNRIERNGEDSGLLRLVAYDGTERVWMYRNTLYEREGSRTWVLGHALDVTQRIGAERALREAQVALQQVVKDSVKENDELALRVNELTAELQQANERLRLEIEQRNQMEEERPQARRLESLGVLAGGIAYDLNNFLMVVHSNIELVRMRLDPDGPVDELLEQMAGACQRSTLLASQLLALATGGSPERRVVSVATLVLDAVSLARAGAPTTIHVDIADDLWSAEVDASQVSQVLDNILLNAKQAMPDAGIIEVHAENVVVSGHTTPVPGSFVRISVRDYGCGIRADVLPRIFDPYFTTKPTHNGLGLPTSYAIILKHGGHISVGSEVGKGTVFTIDLPAAQVRL